MTRGRILTLSGIVVLVGIGLTALMAARGDKDAPNAGAAKPASSRLVCIGEVDTNEPRVGIFPENFPMMSRVTDVLVKEGDKVRKGQPLLTFDVEMLSLKVEEANRGIAAARFEQTKAEAGVREHAWKVNAADRKWKAKEAELAEYQSELKEAQRLFGLEVINKLQLVAAEKKVLSAELNLDAAKIELEGLRADVPSHFVEQAKAKILVLENQKHQAERARDQMACKAPADGKIIRSFVSDGYTFHPTSRDPAFWFIKDGPLIVRANVAQEFARRVVLGKSATIEDEADSQQVWKGRVTKISDQFLPKRQGGGSALDFLPVNDDPVLECQISIELAPGETGPKYGQKVRISLE
jgi:multidrug efflux pump subunit AcrA (membrane-fusion protein)